MGDREEVECAAKSAELDGSGRWCSSGRQGTEGLVGRLFAQTVRNGGAAPARRKLGKQAVSYL